MTTTPYSVKTDVTFSTYNVNENTSIGTASVYYTQPHPGSGKKIQGWMWDRMQWVSPQSLKSFAFVPMFWDSSTSGLDSSYFQSGYGDGDDLKLLSLDYNIDIPFTETVSGAAHYSINPTGQEITALVPTVNHGWYYIQDKRWYLYSDSYQAEVVSGSNTVSGYQVHTLKYSPKLATPIEVFNFIYNQKTQTYQKDIVFQKTIAFTNSGITPEFTLSGQVVSLNGVYTTTIGILGSPLTYENLGTRNGNAGQTFHTNHSPLDKSVSPHLYVSTTSNGLIDLTAAIGSSIIVDYDLGTVQFITADSYIGGAIFLYYGVGFNIFYEPKNTTNTITATTASVNPALDGIGAGFIQVSISDRNISNV
jgi:hypothetical protein